MRNFFKNNAKIKVLLGIFVLIILIQAALLTTLYRSQDNKDFEVNLVQIKTEKDSVDFLKMKNDLAKNRKHLNFTITNFPSNLLATLILSLLM